MHRHLLCIYRDIYYQNVDLYGNQSVVDEIIENIAVLLHVPRWHLNVVSFFCVPLNNLNW